MAPLRPAPWPGAANERLGCHMLPGAKPTRASWTRLRDDADLRRATCQGAWIGVCIAAGLVAVHALTYYIIGGGVGMDAHAYWVAGHVAHPYQAGPGEMDAYLYSPLFLQVVRPLTLLPWHVFLAVWISLEAAAYWWLLRKAPWRWRVAGLLMAVPELLLGNIYAFIGVAIVLGWRRSAFWGFPLLTKITPAAPGFAWMLAKREWNNVARAALVISALVGLSYTAQPHLWSEWIAFLQAHGGEGVSAVARTAVAVLVTAFAALSDRRWVVPLAVLFSMPVNGGIGLGGPMNGIYAMLAVTTAVYWRQRSDERVRTFAVQASPAGSPLREQAEASN